MLLLGEESRQKAAAAFQVVKGMMDDILSVNRAVDAGATVVFGPESYLEWPDARTSSGKAMSLPAWSQWPAQAETDSEDGVLETTVQMGYTFFQRGANQAKVLDESVLVTVLTLVDKTSGWPLSIQVPRKGTEKSQYVLNAIELHINTLGHKRERSSCGGSGCTKCARETVHRLINGVDFASAICKFGETVMAGSRSPVRRPSDDG
ncbi:unnamed protein product [Effrenium voratum]|nr:unnamed protein product [Effrenium voratum]